MGAAGGRLSRGAVTADDIERIESSGISIPRLVAIIAMQNAIARASMGLDGVMATIAEQAMALTGATGGVVELVDGDAMLYRTTSGSVAAFTGVRIPRAGSLSGLCIARRVLLSAPDTSTDNRVDRAACQRIGAASMVCVPLFHGSEAVGVLKVVSSRPRAFDLAGEATASLLADVITASMHHARDAAGSASLEDGLTGLLNRRAFDRQLSQEVGRSQRHRRALSLAMFDLDGLERASDSLGHAAGDAILRDAASLLRAALRNHDGCFRLGGDGFAAILPETTETAARTAVGRYCTSLLAARLGNGIVGVSAGVAEFRPGEAPGALTARADAALYDHKRRSQSAASLPLGSVTIPRLLPPGSS
jgi:diguanylate cyclase (GGDEF)-like protein